jgi:LPXTG-motif cell wall-anchored protein
VSFTFTALAAGSADISLDSSTLIGTAGETTVVDVTVPGLAATVAIAAAPVAPVPSPSPTATTPAATLPISGDTGSDTGTGPLASTGADATPWITTGIIGAALVALGAVLVVRHRRQEATR